MEKMGTCRVTRKLDVGTEELKNRKVLSTRIPFFFQASLDIASLGSILIPSSVLPCASDALRCLGYSHFLGYITSVSCI